MAAIRISEDIRQKGGWRQHCPRECQKIFTVLVGLFVAISMARGLFLVWSDTV